MSENTIWIYDAIGDLFGSKAVTAKGVRDTLQAAGDASSLLIRINSPGGAVDDAVAIHTLLREHPARKIVKVDGIAASAASLIAMAGDRIEMASGSQMMVHHPWTMAVGNYKELRTVADVAEGYSKSAAQMYVARTGRPMREVAAAMDAGTYFTAEEAVSFGLADSVGRSTAIAAKSQEQVMAQAMVVAKLAFAALVGQAPEQRSTTMRSLQQASLELARARARAVA